MTYLHLNSWAGKSKTLCTILKENKNSYVVRLDQDCIKGKVGTTLKRVPKYAISLALMTLEAV